MKYFIVVGVHCLSIAIYCRGYSDVIVVQLWQSDT